MKINNKGGSNSSTVFLVFSKGKLKYTAKSYLANFGFGEKKLKKEVNILRLLKEKMYGKGILDTIPDIVTLDRFSDRLVLLTSAFDGVQIIPDMLSVQRKNKIYVEAIERSYDWLERFYLAQNTRKIRLDNNLIDLHIKAPLRNFYSNFGSESNVFSSSFEKCVNKWHTMRGLELPLILSHGDFNPHNILFGNGSLLGVIDWEDATQLTFPFCDILHYRVLAGRELRGGRDYIAQNFKDYFLEEGWYKETTEKLSIRLLESVGIDKGREIMELYTPVYLASMANKEIETSRVHMKRSTEWIQMLSIYFNSSVQ